MVTLADWYALYQIMASIHLNPPRYHIVSPRAGAIPKPDATLINGKGRYVGGPPSALAVVSVEQGLRYRFRLVSISCDSNYNFSIDGHMMGS